MKKILIGLAVIVVTLGGIYAYVNYRNRSLSPAGEASIDAGSLTVAITYSRPSVRGRVIFGTEEEHALQPYGKYWRLGANEATEISISNDVMIGDQALKAGTYRLYAIPGKESFDLFFNSELGQWGYFEPNKQLDVLNVSVPVTKSEPTELYTITMQSPAEGEVDVVFKWSDVQFTLPLRAK